MNTPETTPRSRQITSRVQVAVLVMLVSVLVWILLTSPPPRMTPTQLERFGAIQPEYNYQLLGSKPDSSDSLKRMFLLGDPVTRRVIVLTCIAAACDTVPWMPPNTLRLTCIVRLDSGEQTIGPYRVKLNPFGPDHSIDVPNYPETDMRPKATPTTACRLHLSADGRDHG